MDVGWSGGICGVLTWFDSQVVARLVGWKLMARETQKTKTIFKTQMPVIRSNG